MWVAPKHRRRRESIQALSESDECVLPVGDTRGGRGDGRGCQIWRGRGEGRGKGELDVPRRWERGVEVDAERNPEAKLLTRSLKLP